jgi:D-beta-D-heptose 7-phosphate kinase/D-beta-D-heptose 1-phosphate adenosyltransferase
MIEDYKNTKILVIGDSCVDVFRYGYTLRLAPEGPAPVFNPIRETFNGGMASNVQANINAIGAEATLITQKEEITKVRYIDERTNSLLLRVDSNDTSSRIEKNILENIIDNKFEDIIYDAIVISDYCKGFLLEEDIYNISQRNFNIFLDTKKILGDWCKNISFIKINESEFDRTFHTIEKLGIDDNLIITRSDKGCEYNKNIFPVEKVNIKDLSGAGDTFISGLAVNFAKTKSIFDAIMFAQECATKVVQKRGVCTI